MPGITDPTEQYFKDGLWGWVTNQWKKLIADAAGHLQVDVIASGLPTGGATAANQTTMITALQLIDDLRNALHTVHTDELDVDVQTSVLPTGAATSVNQTTMITALQLIDDLRNALDSVGTDELDVNVEASVLPTGAATSANQTTMITALQLIDDLRNALHTVATDELDVVIDGQSADIEITQTAPADLTPGIEGWDGSAWRKLPLLWGYSEHWSERKLDLSATAPDDFLSTTPVVAGQLYVAEAISIRWTGTTCTLTQIQITDGADFIILNEDTAPTSGDWLSWSGKLTLSEDDVIKAVFQGLTANDNIYLRVWGYKMKITE